MTRNRSRTLRSPDFGDAIARHYDEDGDLVSSDSYNILLDHATESMTDVNSPGYSRKQNDGEVVINPVTHVKHSNYVLGEGSYHWTRTNGHTYKWDGPGLTSMQVLVQPSYMVPIQQDPVPSYDMEAACKLQALGNVDRSPYSFAEDLAEMRKTILFMRNPLGALKKLSKAFNERSDFIQKSFRYKKRADALAKAWLEYRFAFLPLYRSLEDLTMGLMDVSTRPKRRTAHGSANFIDTNSDKQLIVTWESEAATSVTIEAHAGIIYEVSNPLNDWNYKYGLRFKDIPETLWAVLPLSFMVDRVYNLTQALRGLESFIDPNVTMLGAWTSTRTTRLQTRTWLRGVSAIIESVQLEATDTTVEETETYVRDEWVPSFSDLKPEFRGRELVDSASKVIDLLTLLWSNLR